MENALKIPKVIYFTWISEKPIPEKFNKYIESWSRVMPDFEIKQITLENVKRGPFVNKAIELKNYALAGHYARVEELYLNGGVYFDIDIEATRTVEDLMHNDLVLGAESKWWINNAVIISKAKHPYLLECLNYMDSVKDFDSVKIELETGPIMFTNIMKKWGWRPGDAMRIFGKDHTISIVPPVCFYPYHYDQFYTPECVKEETFTVHHWANSWNNKVSIIVPCYNQANFLDEAIDSCLKQTYKDFEIIIVNDGSTDNTSAVAEAYKIQFPKLVKVIHQENKGLSAARNAGIKKASGGWILTLDADDKIHHDFLLKTVGVNDIVSTRLQTFGTESRSWKSPLTNPTYEDFLSDNHINCCSLFKKDVWTLTGGYDEKMKLGFEDYEFWLRATKAGFNVTSIDQTLFYYRKRGESMFTNALKNKETILSYMKTKHPMKSPKKFKRN